MDTSLNADAALRAYLPPESWEGEAQHRFVFRTPEGDEEPLLARMAVIRPDQTQGTTAHCLILRPENAEVERIFVALDFKFWGDGECINSLLTRDQGRHFNWSAVGEDFTDSNASEFSRFASVKDGERDVLLRFDSDGRGAVLGPQGERSRLDVDSEPFIWKYGLARYESLHQLQFLRQTEADFQQYVRDCWSDVSGDIRVTARWQLLSEPERAALAFHCRNGEWDELVELAQFALQVRLSQIDAPSPYVCRWDFAEFPVIKVHNARLSCDKFLQRWRAALTRVFEVENIDARGRMIGRRASCVWGYVGRSSLGWVYSSFPSQHELLEARLSLRDWATKHLSPEEAERLLTL